METKESYKKAVENWTTEQIAVGLGFLLSDKPDGQAMLEVLLERLIDALAGKRLTDAEQEDEVKQ